jgi:membrane-anchored glycerophosphoryl diester phosphodiesterase (GDPDase)
MLPLLFYFGARLMLMTPAAAAEEVGPIGLIVRSWRLTAGSVWKLIGFLILIALLVGILSTVVQIIGGLFFALVAGPPEPGSLSALLVTTLMAGVNTVVAVCLTSLIARMYTQLAGSAPSDVFA